MTKKAVVEEVLLDIYREEGVLLPETIVQRARVRSHPLHACFEWNNTKAAERYRLLQASQLIRTVEVRISTADDSYRVRAFHALRNVGHQDQRGYLHESDIDGSDRTVLLRSLHRDWVAFKRRYEHLREFWELVGVEQEQQVG